MKPQRVKIERQSLYYTPTEWYDVKALFRFHGWVLIAETKHHRFALKVASLARKTDFGEYP